MEETEEIRLYGQYSENLAKVLHAAVEKLIGESVHEKTELSMSEIKKLTVLRALAELWANRNGSNSEQGKQLAQLINNLCYYYEQLKISHKRRSRQEIVKIMSAIAKKAKEVEDKQQEVKL